MSNNKPMMIITMGYTDYVVSVEDGMTLMNILGNAYKYERKYNQQSGEYAYFAYPSDIEVSCKLMNGDLFAMAKLAGKPEKN